MDIKQKIELANAEAANRLIQGDPVLVDIAPAGEVIPGLQGKMITHAGPPIEWQRMCGAQRGAIIGMVLFEGWAETVEEAETMLARGEVRLEPNHDHQAVGPMAGTISPSLPVFVVENKAFGNRAYCRNVEGMQQFGDYSENALNGLRFWRDTAAPAMRRGVQQAGGINLKPIITQALQMGDELHNRHTAASSLIANALSIPMILAGVPQPDLLKTLGLLDRPQPAFPGYGHGLWKSHRRPGPGYRVLDRGDCHVPQRRRVRYPGKRAGR